jgi:hypothetical protein
MIKKNFTEQDKLKDLWNDQQEAILSVHDTGKCKDFQTQTKPTNQPTPGHRQRRGLGGIKLLQLTRER